MLSLYIIEKRIQIQTTKQCHFIPVTLGKFENLHDGKCVQRHENPYATWWDVNWNNHSESHLSKYDYI